MADLEERGQLILVAAFALAVIFIALALIVNSAIFTENLASRGETSGGDGALSMRAMVEESAGANLERVNREGIDNHGNIESAMDTSLSELSTQIGRQEARKGRLVNVSEVRDRTDGNRIYEEDPSNDRLASSSFEVTDVSRATTDGGVVENGTRAFRIEVHDITDTSSTNRFKIIAAGSNDWVAEIYYLSSPDRVRVETTNNDIGASDECEVQVDTSQPFQIDVTDGTIDDEPCSALRETGTGENFAFAAGAGDTYDIRFANPGAVKGNFSMTVNSPSGINTPGDPVSEEALYDVTVRYGYSTSDLTYVSEVRVAPGEPDE